MVINVGRYNSSTFPPILNCFCLPFCQVTLRDFLDMKIDTKRENFAVASVMITSSGLLLVEHDSIGIP